MSDFRSGNLEFAGRHEGKAVFIPKKDGCSWGGSHTYKSEDINGFPVELPVWHRPGEVRS